MPEEYTNMENAELENEEIESVAGESKADCFVRLAVARVNRLLNGIDTLGKLSNRASYEYTDEQVAKMFTALREVIDETEAKFKPKEKRYFTF